MQISFFTTYSLLVIFSHLLLPITFCAIDVQIWMKAN